MLGRSATPLQLTARENTRTILKPTKQQKLTTSVPNFNNIPRRGELRSRLRQNTKTTPIHRASQSYCILAARGGGVLPSLRNAHDDDNNDNSTPTEVLQASKPAFQFALSIITFGALSRCFVTPHWHDYRVFDRRVLEVITRYEPSVTKPILLFA